MHRVISALLLLAMFAAPLSAAAADSQPVKKYFAHPAVEDRDGVIAPWYRGQNGQCDFRVRVAAETLKRYPWTDKPVAVMAAPASSSRVRGAFNATGKSASVTGLTME